LKYFKDLGIIYSQNLVFLFKKLQHSSERPYSWDVYFFQYTLHTNKDTHQYMSLDVFSGHMI